MSIFRSLAPALVLLLALTACAGGGQAEPTDTPPTDTPPADAPSPLPSETASPTPTPTETPGVSALETVSYIDERGTLSYDLPATWQVVESPGDAWLAYSEPMAADDAVAIISMQPGQEDAWSCEGDWSLLGSEPVDPLPDGVLANGGELLLVTWSIGDNVIVAIQSQQQVDEGCMSSAFVGIGDVLLAASTPFRVDEAGDLWLIGGEHASIDELLASDVYAATLAMLGSLEVLALS